MAISTNRTDPRYPLGDAPTETYEGPDHALLMVMTGLGASPVTGRLLRGLTPWLDAREAIQVYLLAERKWREPWREDETMVSYQELVYWERGPGGGVYRGTAWKNGHLPTEEIVQAFLKEPTSVVEYAARRMAAAVVSSREPVRLEPHFEEKPWGREAWLTAIEKRGVSRVRSPSGRTELPYALGMFPVPLIGDPDHRPILVKILEPHPDPVFGDLYLEVHDEKWETYVVLEVDRAAWPEGVGEVLAGIAPAAIARFAADREPGRTALLAELEARIGAYERVRREMDARLDETRLARGEDPARPLAPVRQRELTHLLPRKLTGEEQRLRAEVEEFFGRVPLRERDVVALPPGVIHSLRHGVRVVEFQTPTYERLIAMFAQKVLTQPHWDTARALARMEMAPFVPVAPSPIEAEPGCRAERAVSYPEFTVDRLRLDPSCSRSELTAEGYHLLFVVEGSGRLILPDGGSQPVLKEDALLLPLQVGSYVVTANEAGPLIWLKAVPREGAQAAAELTAMG